MPSEKVPRHQHFLNEGDQYARYRPTYPPQLAATLADLAPARDLAVDVGCGTGQFSGLLARHFTRVLATDISADQVANAKSHARVDYVVGSAESMVLKDNSASLIVAAQAVHWFDLQLFYREVRRIAIDQAIVALISYGPLHMDGPLDQRFQRFYWQEIAGHWPPERRQIENGYADLEFPFDPLQIPPHPMEHHWTLQGLMGYIRTWSAVKAAQQNHAAEIVDTFEKDMATLWGEPDHPQRIIWPIVLRIGRV